MEGDRRAGAGHFRDNSNDRIFPMTLVKPNPISENPILRNKVLDALKQAIAEMDIYDGEEPPRLDERLLAENLGVSRTPIREAIMCLEQEGVVVSYPRRGAFVVRKSKQEILEIICIWAVLEGLAARMAVENASDEELSTLRQVFAKFDGHRESSANIDEYSRRNIEFHHKVIQLSKCETLTNIIDGLFIHMRAIRRKTIGERDRAARSIIDHMRIIETLEARDGAQAEHLVREHAMNLAEHVRQYVDYLD